MRKEIEAIMRELECSRETAEEISDEMHQADTEQETATWGALEMTDEEGVINAMYDYYYGD